MKILSFGGGVNSTAILILHFKKLINIDVVIFADTGSEFPETYEYIEKSVKPFCKNVGLPFFVVGEKNLFEYYWSKKIVPFRVNRQCTDKFKIRPIHKFAKKHFNDYTFILGIDYGERKRSERFTSFYEFPLIELRNDREGCKQIIRNFGWDVPRKSGCFFCPFTTKKGWKELLEFHPDLYEISVQFEQHGRGYPKYGLANFDLAKFREGILAQRDLCDWLDQCVFCHS